MENQEIEITVAENVYRCGKLDAMRQFHVTRRLGPMLLVAGISLEMLDKGMKVDLDDLVTMSGPVMDLIAKMPDADVEYIVFTCLGVVHRKQGETGWSRVTSPDGRALMFADMDMMVMLRVTFEVLRLNLGNFLPEPSEGPDSTSSSSGAQATTAGRQ